MGGTSLDGTFLPNMDGSSVVKSAAFMTLTDFTKYQKTSIGFMSKTTRKNYMIILAECCFRFQVRNKITCFFLIADVSTCFREMIENKKNQSWGGLFKLNRDSLSRLFFSASAGNPRLAGCGPSFGKYETIPPLMIYNQFCAYLLSALCVLRGKRFNALFI